ncbi:MAG: hypothetical protein QNJ94_01670 [Alphaproteobacteria bacterium]|nr:hypothetical protein [Alphaproteobacteria bacterium]
MAIEIGRVSGPAQSRSLQAVFRGSFVAVLFSAMVSAGPALAEERRSLGLQPYLFKPAPTRPTPAENQRARSYQNKLRGEERRLERGNRSRNTQELNRVRREMNRMDNVISRPTAPRVSRPTGPSVSRPAAPSVSRGSVLGPRVRGRR